MTQRRCGPFTFAFGCLASLLLVGGIFWGSVSAKPGKHPKPTPTPSPTATPAPTPSPSTTPTPTPIPSVSLAWDPSVISSDPATGYFLKYGFVPGGENTVIDVGTQTAWTLQVQSGTTYYFVVTAYDSSGNQSLPSNEITYTVPP